VFFSYALSLHIFPFAMTSYHHRPLSRCPIITVIIVIIIVIIVIIII